jgi:hypothetical protein
MALQRTLQMLKLGERVNDELYRSTIRRPRPIGLFIPAERVTRVRPLPFVPRSF